ncbi:phage holin family protein [Levilactobacillus bambusae]|uniref:Phage holin family protein n=1 Tax=Levilactobacillus bambusae TaxID=2024736 RepID=A0A2V1MZB5_9LACO|nr:phage holin family protein [Levilactobacillus bambusae]PWF99429.1 hypothetical protein DCM90_08225 [Levilactobacillus bambusae]
MGFWSRIFVNWIIFLALAGFFRNSFFISSVWVALLAAFVLAILNALIKPVLQILSLPITILTLGLFSIVINAAMLELTSAIVGPGFEFSSFGITMVIAIIMSICNAIISNHFAN